MTDRPANLFARNPKKTIAATVVVFTLALDVLAGALFIPADRAPFRTPHPYYHHGLLPERAEPMSWGDAEYVTYTNSLGLRDASVRSVPLKTSGKRLLLMGDSTTEGFGVAWEDSFAGLLEERLRPQGIEVLNGGVVSYSPRLYYLKTRYLLDEVGLAFDALYVLIDISDLQDEYLYDDFEPHAEQPLARYRYQARKFLKQHSFLFYALVNLAQSAGGKTDFTPNVNNWVYELESLAEKNPGFGDLRMYWTVDPVVFEKWGRRGLRLAATNMKRLVDLCRRHDVEMTIVVYPYPVQIEHGDLDSVQASFWKTFADASHVGYVNLFPDFIREGADPKETIRRYFIPRDTHWNQEGHRLVAERLLEQIRRDSWSS